MKISNKTKNNFWVYLIKSNTGEVLYIGFGKLKDVVNLTAVNTNPNFNENEEYEIELLDNYENRFEALKAYKLQFMLYEKPLFNREYKTVVRCLTTGEVFKTASDACRRYDIQRSNMSNHLSGKPGFKKVKGLEFRFESEV